MAKLKTIGRSASERFSDAVKSGIEKMAGELGVSLGVAMGMAKAYFLAKGKAQAEVTETDFSAAVAEIKGQKVVVAEVKKEASGEGRDRFPFNEDPDEAQEWWDKGRWSKLKFGAFMTFGGLRKRFAAEIAKGETISKAQVDEYQAELEAKQEAIAKLVNERPDPDLIIAGVKMPCVAKRHSGRNEPEEATQRHPIKRGDDGELQRKRHGKDGKGDEIVAGSFLKLEEFEGELPPGVIKVEEAGKVLFGKYYCAKCRAEALDDFWARKELPASDPLHVDRDAVLTFYTVEGLRTIARREAESVSKVSNARDEEGGSTKRSFGGGGFGSRKGGGFQNWKTGPSRHRGR